VYSYLPLIEERLSDKDFAKTLANWLVNIEIPFRRDNKVNKSLKDVERSELFSAVYALVRTDKLSSTNTKALILDMLQEGVLPENIEKYATEKGYIQVSDESEIAKIVAQVITENQKAADDVRNGEMKAIGFLVGQVMKVSKGKANPALAQKLLKEQLNQ
jgi:aspartyl-tRNA(Asn)/glutamyl-tRNA(Gln) amidotransferase subunit B